MLEQQAATSEVLRVIRQSPNDAQPVFDMIGERAKRLCGAVHGGVFTFDGTLVHVAAQVYVSPEFLEAVRRTYPRAPGRGTASARAILTRAIVNIPDLEADPEYEFTDTAKTAGFRSALSVPMLRDGTAIGAITVFGSEAAPFSEAHLRLLQTFADQAVIAIENVRLFSELESRNTQLTESLEQQTATAEILRAISSSPTDLRPVLETVVRAAARFCGAPDVAILRLDGDVLRGAAAVGPFGEELASRSGGIEGLAVPVSRGSVSGRAVTDRRSLHIHDLATEPETEFPVGRDLQRRFGHHTMLATPLSREGVPLGVILLFRTEVRPFSDRQLELVRIFADQAVIAIENVRLFQELQARNGALSEALDQQTATGEVLRVISRSTVDLQPVLETVVENATRLCGAVRGHIFRVDGDFLRFAAAYGAWPGFREYLAQNPVRVGPGTAAGRAASERRVIHIQDVRDESGYQYGELVKRQDYRTVLAVPILREDALFGVIAILKSHVEPFTDKQIELVTTFADQAAIAIENVRLLTELQSRNHALTESLEQQTATSDILRVISSSPTDVQPVFEIIAERATKLCDAEVAVVSRVDGTVLQLAAIHGVTRAGVEAVRRVFPMPTDFRAVTARVFRERAVVHVADVLADQAYAMKDEAVTAGWRAGLGAPMFRDGQVIGVIFVGRSAPGLFSDQRVELLKTFADQAVIAIENVRLFRELEVRNRDLTETLEQQTATSDILRVISSSPTDVQPVFDAVAESAARLCESFDSAIWRRDGDRLLLVAHHGPIPMGTVGEFTLSIEGTAAGRAILNARTEQVRDMQQEASEFPESSAHAHRMGYRTLLCVPLIREGTAIGAISLRRTEVHLFADRQVALLQTFADQAVIAIENVRLFRELEVRNRDLTESLEQQTATSHILGVISSSPTDVQPVFDTIAQSARALCAADSAGVLIFDGQMIHLEALDNADPDQAAALRLAYPMAANRGHATGRAVLTGTPAHIADVREDPEYTLARLRDNTGLRSVLSVPMLREGRPIGAIAVQRWGSSVRPFSDKQIALLETFAAQAVIAIQNVRLFDELEVRNRDLTESLDQQTATGEILRVISSSPTDVQPVFET
ncbi:MAG TPA: GAF domain-containing protein, partial [Methylomirabilota bacterium]